MILYLFDIDGTLLHARGSGARSFDAVFAAHHGIARACEGVRFGGKTDPQLVDEIFVARLGRPATESEHAAFLDAYLARLDADLAGGGVDVLAGVTDALAWLAVRPDVMLGVATGNVRAGADAKLASAGLRDYFVLGGYGSDSHRRAELVAAAIARAQQRAEIREVVVVGDTVHDISAARACGAVACAVATGSDPAEALADADAVLRAMTELPAWHTARFGGALTAPGAPTGPVGR
jgi:phosphoglycolate phosphatase-like HAD superfamily hydrolase